MPLLLVKYTLLSEKLPERDEAVEAVANRETEVCAKTFSNFVEGLFAHTRMQSQQLYYLLSFQAKHFLSSIRCGHVPARYKPIAECTGRCLSSTMESSHSLT